MLRVQTGDVAERAPAQSDGAVARGPIALAVETDLAKVEHVWRAFERTAGTTAFQAFAWQSAWQRHIGARRGVTPAIVVGRRSDGSVLFILPLAVEPAGAIRRLTWLAAEVCDYAGPLLAPDFSESVTPQRFSALWREIGDLLRAHQELHHDIVVLEKLPERVGNQANPFLGLGATLNASGAHLSHLGADWATFYAARRSSSTRRRDRTKRKRLADLGEVTFVTPSEPAEILSTLDTLLAQKSKSFAHMGVANMFARPGALDFLRAVATDTTMPELIHVSRLDVGDVVAAANLGLMFGGRYYHFLASYDDGPTSRFGPGAAHLRDLMQYAIEHGCSLFDFTIGDEPYKREWSDEELKLYDVRAPVTFRGLLAAMPAMVLARVKRTIKQTPVLWKTFTFMRAKVAALKGKKDVAAAPPADDEENAG